MHSLHIFLGTGIIGLDLTVAGAVALFPKD
jgi:hypothetical protein